MIHFKQAIKSMYHAICKIEEFICYTGFVVMIVSVFVSAIFRGLRHPLAWSIDIAQLLLCWTTLLGADIAFRQSKFLGLDIVVRHFPVKIRRSLGIIIDLIILSALVIFIFYGIRLSIDSWKRSFQTLKISHSYVTMALPIMSVFMSVSVILDLVKKFKNFNEPVSGTTQN